MARESDTQRFVETGDGLVIIRKNGAREVIGKSKPKWLRDILEKYDPDQPRDEQGRWTSGGGGGGGAADKPSAPFAEKPAGGGKNASDLLKPTTTNVDSIVRKIPGASAKIAEVEGKLSQGTRTSALVSQGGHKNPDGSWTAERTALHEEIVNSYFTPEKVAAATPAEGEQPVLHLIGGRGGSGKSWFTKPGGTIDASKAIVIDNDDIKAGNERLGVKGIPEYEGWNAALVHDEAKMLGQRAEKIARDNGLNVVLDGTMRTTKEFTKKVDAFREAGYRIEGHYMFLSPEVSTERAIKRFMEVGRYVPPDYTFTSRTNEQTFDSVKDQMANWEIYDNSGAAPKLYARKQR